MSILLRKSLVVCFILIVSFSLISGQDMDKQIRGEIVVNASAEKIFAAWTTLEGVKSFFAPDAKVELKVGGAYEMYFIPDAEPGSRGGEGNTILAFDENKMLSFTWNAPPSLPNVRKQKTHVTVYFESLSGNQTKVILIHDGWGTGEEWDKAFEYFSNAWEYVVLPRLKYAMENGPIDWANPPKLEGN